MTSTITETTRYSPPYLLLPFNPAPGDTWSNTYTVSSRGSLPSGEPYSHRSQLNQSARVEGYQMVTTPAGRFRALRITMRQANSNTEAYWVERIGTVKSNAVELINYQ